MAFRRFDHIDKIINVTRGGPQGAKGAFGKLSAFGRRSPLVPSARSLGSSPC
jgi:hypothetical protein